MISAVSYTCRFVLLHVLVEYDERKSVSLQRYLIRLPKQYCRMELSVYMTKTWNRTETAMTCLSVTQLKLQQYRLAAWLVWCQDSPLLHFLSMGREPLDFCTGKEIMRCVGIKRDGLNNA